MIKKILGVLLTITMLFAFTSCKNSGGSDSSSGSSSDSSKPDEPSISIDVEENFSFDNALSDKSKWKGLAAHNPVIDEENKFLTFREKSNNIVFYGEKGMSTGDIKLKMKVGISKDTTATVCFSNQASNLSSFFYEADSKTYAIEFASDSYIYAKKWINGSETVLKGAKSKSSVPLALSANFTDVVISVTEDGGKVNIKAYVGGNAVIDVADKDSPILGGGAVGVSYQGMSGMAIGGETSDAEKYVEPEALGVAIYDSPDVEVAETSVNLLENFEQNWTGRERIFSYKTNADGTVSFSGKDNPEEPQGGVSEFQGLYKSKLFKNVKMTYEFSQPASGEWVMFWLRCVPEKSQNVSIWGNKKTRENTNGYSVLITNTGYVQFHKWSDFSQIWLNGQGTKVSGDVLSALADSKSTVKAEISIEEIQMGGKPAVNLKIKIGSVTVQVTDTDNPFTNPGYIGLQGYSINDASSEILLRSAVVTPIEE